MAEMIPRSMIEERRNSCLRTAHAWKANGNSSWYTRNTWAAIHDLEISVCFYPDIPAARAYLSERSTPQFLHDLVIVHEAAREESIRLKRPVGNDIIRYCLFACTCWLMEADEVAQRWINLGLHPAARTMLNRFDITFMDAHAALAAKESYSLDWGKKYRGWEKRCLQWAELAAAITRGEDVTSNVAEMRKWFDRRNRTAEHGDNYGLLEGSKSCPASFDIRLEGILSYKRRHYD